MALLLACAGVASQALAETLAGTVRDPNGVPLRGAFVRARSDTKTRITATVFSDSQGRYRFEDLAPGGYQVWAEAVGYESAAQASVNVAADRAAARDFALGKGVVKWSDLSNHQMLKLLPASKGKEMLNGRCLICHGFQSRMAAKPRNEAGWTAAVKFMQTAMHFNLAGRFNDQNAADVTQFLNESFGVDSKLPKSPAEMPGYAETVRQFSDDSLKVVYVDYDLPQPNSFPFSAAPDKNGKFWIPEFGRANRVARLDPNTGEMQEFRAPHQGTAAIHSAVPAPDGSIWMAQQGSNKLGKLDPRTGVITEYQADYEAGKEGWLIGGSKHTSRVDSKGNVWSSGYPFTKFDPKTGKFTYYKEGHGSYDVAVDADDNGWFTTNIPSSTIGRVDAKTDQVKTWVMPTKGYLRRLQIDSKGIVWVGEYEAGKIARFDPKTETFKEFDLPGPLATPYAMGIDRNDHIWYSSHDMDVLGRLDPATGKVTEYPAPYPENTMKEFFLDAQGRLWYGSPPNNKVGYFIVPGMSGQ
jgi:virginiamycin B lyase